MRAQQKTTQSEPGNVLRPYPAQPRRKGQSALLKKLSDQLDKLESWVDEEATPAERAFVMRTLKGYVDQMKASIAKRVAEKPPRA